MVMVPFSTPLACSLPPQPGASSRRLCNKRKYALPSTMAWMAGFGQAWAGFGRLWQALAGFGQASAVGWAPRWIIGPKPCRPGVHPPHQSACVASGPSSAVALHPPLSSDCGFTTPLGHAWHFQASRRRLPGQSVHGLSSLPRQETSVGLDKPPTTLAKLSCGWFYARLFGHVHRFAPSPTNLWQTSHCAVYSRFAHRLSPLTCAFHSLPEVVWVGVGVGVGKWQLQLFYTKAGKSQRQENRKMGGKNDHGALPRGYHFWPKADSLGSKSINPCLVW